MRASMTLFVALAVSAQPTVSAPERSNTMIVYQPDIVAAGRLFMVALKVPPAAPEVTVAVPDCAELFDRTPLPARTDLRKYYFRALKPAKKATLEFVLPDRRALVSLIIWSFDDLRRFRKLKGVQLPRRWPLGETLPELKEGQTVTTEKQKTAAKGRSPSGRQWLKLTDDQIWNLQPDSTIPRWHWVNLRRGCPVHGTEIYRGRAFYPWLHEDGVSIRQYSHPTVPYTWKMRCPVGKELYPSNDFAHGDMTSGPFPDDGIGGACNYKGEKYGFIAELCQAYCHKMLHVAPECADGYLATGDMRYVHKALVAFSRLAVEYAYLATMTQHRHRNNRRQVDRLGPAPFREGPCLAGSGFTVYCIDQPTYQWRHAEAYDKIWPVIEQDQEILPFLRKKGFALRTHEDLRRFLEENLFAVWMQGAMDLATRSNEPYHQRGLARTAEVLNYKRGNEFMDWLYDGAGHMRFFVPNTFFRDGAPYESSGGYNGMHVTAIGPIIESVEHLRRLRPDVYPAAKYPDFSKSRRYHNIFDFSMDTVNIDRTYPRVGDDGSFPHYAKRPKRAFQNGGVAAFEHAYKVFRDPKFAWALVHTRGWKPSLDFPYTRNQIEAEAAKWPDDWNDHSRLKDGYGLALLRSGKGDNKRALWMEYGRPRGHTHDDMFHLGLDAFQSEILGHLGYPRNWNYWTKTWLTQNLAKQIPFVNMTATCRLFADAGPVHLAEALAQGFSDRVGAGRGYTVSEDNWQRRMLVLVDVSAEQFYCLDLYTLFGGKEHWWTFHCQEGAFSTTGLNLVKQPQGTLAGPDVPYGDEDWLEAHGCRRNVQGYRGSMYGFPFLYNVQRAKPTGVWFADWTLKDADGLHFRLTVPTTTAVEVVVCDGKSPAGASPYEMKWVLLHNQGESPLTTRIADVMELYRGEPVIRRIRPLSLTPTGHPARAAVGLVIELTSGRIDTVFTALDPAVEYTAPGGFRFSGRFGLFSERQGAPVHVVLIGGTRLTRNGVGLTTDTAEYRAVITQVDRATETVTVSPPPDPDALVGKYVFLTNPHRRVAYKVVKTVVVGKWARVQLALDSRIGTGKVTGYGDHLVKTSTPFQLRGFRYYDGARLVNAEGTAEYRLSGIKGGAFIDPHTHKEVSPATLAKQFPLGTWFNIYDYGPGDELVLPTVAVISRQHP